MKNVNPHETASWQNLDSHFYEIFEKELKTLFQKDPKRFEKFSLKFDSILFDFSKNYLTEETLTLLTDLATECGLEESISGMFNGELINKTENRAVLHTALRNRSGKPVFLNGKDVMPEILEVLEQMKQFSGKVRSGEWKGFSGKPIKDIVNIGIGGSDLGPVMVCNALKHYADGPKVHFVSNVDGSHIFETLKELNSETTLFLIVSKTFTTQETMLNATSAKKWFEENGGKDVSKHFVAVSTNATAVAEFGIDTANMFRFWDFVGGRFSLWSAVGLSIVLSVGYDNFELLLSGAHRMDEHFRTTPFKKNIPVIMAMVGIWYTNFFTTETETILPYDQYLDRLPAYLQQAIMESNGKSVDRNGNDVEYSTSPVIWGEPGTNGQHSFYQLIHQGTPFIPSIFMAAAQPLNNMENHHQALLSNYFAQTEALMNGKTEETVIDELKKQGKTEEEIEFLTPFKCFVGGIPTTSILYQKLTPEVLGSLLSMFENRLFVQGVIWNIFSFDQWGVELGKQLAKQILPELSGDENIETHDNSTNGLINTYKEMRK